MTALDVERTAGVVQFLSHREIHNLARQGVTMTISVTEVYEDHEVLNLPLWFNLLLCSDNGRVILKTVGHSLTECVRTLRELNTEREGDFEGVLDS